MNPIYQEVIDNYGGIEAVVDQIFSLQEQIGRQQVSLQRIRSIAEELPHADDALARKLRDALAASTER